VSEPLLAASRTLRCAALSGDAARGESPALASEVDKARVDVVSLLLPSIVARRVRFDADTGTSAGVTHHVYA
jgi:hypothetical protein